MPAFDKQLWLLATESQTWLSISDLLFFLLSLLFSFHLLLLFSLLASVSVSNLHSCLTFTSCRCACMLAKSQRRWIPKGRDCFSCSLLSPGAKFTNLKSFISACVVTKKCFRCFLSAAAIIFGYIFYCFAWQYFVIFLSKCLFLHLELKDQSEVLFIV